MKLASTQGRAVLATTILGSGLAFLDGSIVSLALPAIDDDLDAGLAGLQWVVNGYMLALAGLILIGGSLGDRFGRRRIYVVGVAIFAGASVACAAAWSIEALIAARVLQGVGGALLTPGSLAILSAVFDDETDRARAIGLWSGMSGVTMAIGPLLGGWLVEHVGWQTIFWINVPLAMVVIGMALRWVPDSRGSQGRQDVAGAALTAAGLAVLTYGLVVEDWTLTAIGLALLVVFVIHQAKTPHALVPLQLFADRVFTAANLCTFAIYGALAASGFLLVLQLQYVAGFTPIQAGLASIPTTIIMLLFSSRAGALGARIGPRLPMTLGPVIAAAGLALWLPIDESTRFVTGVLPGALVFGAGLTLLVAPLTTAVLSSAPADRVGIASGINNAVARTASLLAVAAIPPLAGIAGADFAEPEVFSPGFRTGTGICIAMLVTGGVLAALLIRRNQLSPPAVTLET